MKILWLNCRLLHPLIGGDRIRTYEMLRHLRTQHEIVYLCLQVASDDPSAPGLATEYCDRLVAVPHPDYRRKSVGRLLRLGWEALFRSTPLIATKYDSPGIREQLARILAEERCDLLVCDYLAPMVNLVGLEREIGIPVVLFHHNVESLIWRRHTENARNPLRRFLYWLQWRRTFRFEDLSTRLVDGHVTVSEVERDYFARERGFRNVLGAVPTGVDFERFSRAGTPSEPRTLAFLGAMDWHANVDSVCWFAEVILPRIRARFPDVRFLVVGRNPGPRIEALAKADPLVEVSGTVPSVVPWLHRASTMVLPLRVGGGTRIKVYEGVAAGVPLVSTSVGVEGLDLESPAHFRRADSADEFVAEVLALLDDPAQADAMAQAALAHVRERYGWEAVCEQFTALVQGARKIDR